MDPLLLPYLANLLILLPIAPGTLLALFDVGAGRFAESAGWRTLVGSLWSAILVGSVFGLFDPVRWSPLLVLQVVYKSLWLAVYVAPRLRTRERLEEIHPGIAITFLAIVATYPFAIPWRSLLP